MGIGWRIKTNAIAGPQWRSVNDEARCLAGVNGCLHLIAAGNRFSPHLRMKKDHGCALDLFACACRWFVGRQDSSSVENPRITRRSRRAVVHRSFILFFFLASPV